MNVLLRTPFMLAISLLSQRQLASGPVPAAAPRLLIVQQVEEAVQLQVASKLICHQLLLPSSVLMRSCS